MLEPPSIRGQLPGPAELSPNAGALDGVYEDCWGFEKEYPCILASLTDPAVRGFYYPNSARPAAVDVLVWKAVSSQSGPRKAQRPPAARANWLKHGALASHLRQLRYRHAAPRIVRSQRAGPPSWREGRGERCRRATRRGSTTAQAPPLERSQFDHTRSDLWAKSISRIYCRGCIGDVTTAKDFDFSGSADRLTSQATVGAPSAPLAHAAYSILSSTTRETARRSVGVAVPSGIVYTDNGGPAIRTRRYRP
jgi:hypothetical protein